MGKVIEVRDLYKLYRVGDEIVRALDGVNSISARANSARSSERPAQASLPC